MGGNPTAGKDTGRATGTTSTRAVALVGPAGAGKTTLAEALLFASGTLSRQGSVEAGSTVGDASPEARNRRGSTETNLMHFAWGPDRFALVDVPGPNAFATDGLAALPACDLAIVVIDPAPERAMMAEPWLRRLDEAHIPHAIFVNKIETARSGALRQLIAELQPMSRAPLVLRQIPIREDDHVVGYVDLALERAWRYRAGTASEAIGIPAGLAERESADRTRLLETLADFDDGLLETLLSDEQPLRETVMADLAADTAEGKVVPVIFGSALGDGGLRRLLKLLRHETPSPALAAARLGLASGGVFHAFKVANGGAMGRLVLGRLFDSTLTEGDELCGPGGSIRAGAVLSVQGERFAKQARAESGDIVAVGRLEGVAVGDRLARRGAAMPSPATVLQPERNGVAAITARNRKDDVKLSAALHRLCEEDVGLDWSLDEASRETLLRAMNEDHLAVVIERLERRFGIAVDARGPRIAYRESIRKEASRRGRHKKQSGGHGQYGDVTLEVRPLPRGEGFRFSDRITGGAVPKQWIPAVEEGVRDAMEHGPLGFPVVDVEVVLTDGSYHAVDSSELAFRLAGRLAMAEALAAAGPYLLEPVARVTVDMPGATGSRASTALSSRRGQILGLAPHPARSRWERVEALLPQSGLAGLDAELRSQSQGLAEFSARFDHYAELGGRHADEVVKSRASLAA